MLFGYIGAKIQGTTDSIFLFGASCEFVLSTFAFMQCIIFTKVEGSVVAQRIINLVKLDTNCDSFAQNDCSTTN